MRTVCCSDRLWGGWGGGCLPGGCLRFCKSIYKHKHINAGTRKTRPPQKQVQEISPYTFVGSQ